MFVFFFYFTRIHVVVFILVYYIVDLEDFNVFLNVVFKYFLIFEILYEFDIMFLVTVKNLEKEFFQKLI